MDRRKFVSIASAATVAMATGLGRGEPAAAAVTDGADAANLKRRWQKLDDAARGWWNGDLQRADEEAIRQDGLPHSLTPTGERSPWSHSPPKTLIFLPFPYSSGGGSVASFPEMYGWDTHFINLGLFAHDRTDIVRWNILDQLSMIERFGKVLNGNRTFYLTRGQPPLLAMSIEKYLSIKKDDDEVAMLAYPLLERSYTGYWNAPAHATPIGLSTCRDGGGKDLRPELASECEAGLDFTPIFSSALKSAIACRSTSTAP